jgi:ATP-dependent DNA ligase
LSRFEELSRHEAARTAILHAFDLIEHYGEDLRNRPFLDRKAALGRLLREAAVDMRFAIRRGSNVNVPRTRAVRTMTRLTAPSGQF